MRKKNPDSNSDVNFSTNSTLKYYQGSSKPTIFLAAFMRAKVISISQLKYQEMSAMLNVDIIITISYRGISNRIKNMLLNQGIPLSFEKDMNILLNRNNPNVTITDNSLERRVSFVVRKFVATRLVCNNLFISPFELIQCPMVLTLNRTRIARPQGASEMSKNEYNLEYEDWADQNVKMIEFHFNLMDNSSEQKKLMISDDSDFGLFGIASKLLKTKYTPLSYNEAIDSSSIQQQHGSESSLKNEIFNNKVIRTILESKLKRKDRVEEKLPLLYYAKQLPEAFNTAHFVVLLYKKPAVSIMTIFLPLFLLSIFNLGIFYEEQDLHKRILSVSSIMISIIALIPVIREQIPPTSQITLVEILVFAEALTTLLALFDSLHIVTLPADQFVSDGFQRPLFIISFIITIIVYGTILVLIFLYYFHLRKTYIDESRSNSSFADEQQIMIYEWINPKCDEEFLCYYKSGSLKVIQDSDEKIGLVMNTGLKLKANENSKKKDKVALDILKNFNLDATKK